MINYKTYDYFKNRPEVTDIFEDLEELLDFCRLDGHAYDPTCLYNRNSRLWRAFERSRKAASIAPVIQKSPKPNKK